MSSPNHSRQSNRKPKGYKREKAKTAGKKVVEKTKDAINRVFNPVNSSVFYSSVGEEGNDLEMIEAFTEEKIPEEAYERQNENKKKPAGFFKRMNERLKKGLTGKTEEFEQVSSKKPPIYKKDIGRKQRKNLLRVSLPKELYRKCRTMQAEGLTAEAITLWLEEKGYDSSCFFKKENKLQKLIENALKNEETAPYGRSKLMIVGKGRAGKTSLIKCMLGKVFDPSETSTKGFDVSRVTASNWKEDNDGFLAEHLAQLVDLDKKSVRLELEPSRKKGEKIQIARPLSMDEDEADRLVDLREENEVQVADEEVKRYGMEFKLKQEKGDNLAFSIWDFGGQKAFYSLHHLFLTQYGCYLLVFNAMELVDPSKKQEEVEYLKFWLFSKKIHASLAPILLVATHFDEVEQVQVAEINNIIVKEVLGKNSFGEFSEGKLSFFPVDNKTAFGIDALRKAIEKVVKSQEYIRTCIPVSYLRMIELLSESEKDYMSINEARKCVKKCGLDDHFFEQALCFLSQRGLITYFNEHESLRKFVILQPQWLISAITDVVYDEEEHQPPAFDPPFSRDFRKFCEERVLTAGLLENIWTKKGYSSEVQHFLMTVMRRSSLMCQYDFDAVRSFLVPNLFTTSMEVQNTETDSSEYSGMYFIIDFSGNYDAEIVKDDGRVFVRYMPYGFFERLVCLCVELSAAYHDSIKPKIGDKFAQLSLGTAIDFDIRIANNEEGFPLWIKISTEEEAKMSQVRDLVHKLMSMTDGLRVDFFSGDSGKSELASTLLVPSSKETGSVLAAYKDLQEAFNKKKRPDRIRPSKVSKKKVGLKTYTHWFYDSEGDKHDNLLKDEELPLEEQIATETAENVELTLPKNLEHHCFLSYKQSSAIDLVGKQYYVLSNLGYKCWYDMKQEGDINLDNMMEGIKKSMCYILFLSKDIFPSFYVEEEVKMALKLKKPIIFLHHPRTGSMGYWDFSDYINNAPEVVKPLFEKVESIQIQRRHYLEAAVNKLIDSRLKNIYSQLEK